MEQAQVNAEAAAWARVKAAERRWLDMLGRPVDHLCDECLDRHTRATHALHLAAQAERRKYDAWGRTLNEQK